ncbi:MAG: carboxypeptidase-like regulatory domain-containing protein [Acidobacteriota bacterium]|nr:carboxypeptidase-like regulatory domain-containing protein [Acidobacteriota bacterium]
MKKLFTLRFFVIALFALAAAAWFVPYSTVAEYFIDDPDMPAMLRKAKSAFNKEEFMLRRSNQIAEWRGMADGNAEEKMRIRSAEIQKMQQQEDELRARPASPGREALLAAWVPIGPDPIPNGQTVGVTTPVSGRVTAIDVHPTNPDIVYVGTAQGGLYRSLDGGTTWTQLMQNAQSLAIGAVRIAPSQPSTVYVGTGEPNFSSDSYFGVGVYRIDTADTTPVLNGPFGSSAPFAGRAIAEIIVHPTNPAMIWVASTSAAAAINGGAAPPTTSNRGIYRADNATSGSPTFVQLPNPFANQNLSVRDIEIDPLNPDLLVANVVANGGGIIVYNNATVSPATSAVGVQRATFSSTSTSELTAEFAIQHTVGAPQPTMYAATGNLGGRVLISTDGGVTWTQQIDNNFCTPQCFYDIAIDVDPVDPTRVYLGGSPNLPFGISTTSGTAFVSSSTGLHVDSHAITVAPSNPNIIYFGSDGGIYRSDNLGAAWVPKNTAGFLATQFMGIDNHPTDPNILIGGTQDNGTNRFTTAAVWQRTDFGDGGYSVIDQSSTDNVIYNQYHTYFNASNLTGYAYTNNGAALEGTWTFRGCNSPPTVRNNITCTAVINFYAPLERGPGTPNTIYYGADRLYRSADTGATHTTESQTFTSPLSAIGISPQNDLVRIIGLNDGSIFGTSTGANPLVDLDPSNQVPAAFVTRTVIHPNNTEIAYVTLARFNAPQVYMTSNLSSFASEGLIAPTWTAISGAASGLPQVPVNAFFVDPASGFLYAGTDIGVYVSVNNGSLWAPLGTGFPRIAVFDLEDTSNGQLRAATHGQGIYQIPLLAPTAASVTVSGRVTANGRGVANAIVTYAGETGERKSAITNAFGYYRFEEVPAGQTYVFNVVSKRYTFPSRAVTVSEELSELNFEAQE